VQLALSASAKRDKRVLGGSFGLEGAREAVPMSSEAFSELRCVQDGYEMAIPLDFQQSIGSLLNLAQCTRPDIARPSEPWQPSAPHPPRHISRQC
jgi:hypothetical protein